MGAQFHKRVGIFIVLAILVLVSCEERSVSVTLGLNLESNSFKGLKTQQQKIKQRSAVISAGNNDSSTVKSGLASSSFNLAKTILGAGVLSLPSGIASFSGSKSAIVPTATLLLVMGLVSAYSFSSIGRACKIHSTGSFSDAFAKSVNAPKSRKLISFIITFKTFFACLAYSIIIGDSFSSLMKSFGLPAVLSLRSNVIVGITTLVLFPLCCLKNLDALKYTSLLGLAGVAYTAAFMSVRWADGSYTEGGKYFALIDAALRPKFTAPTKITSKVLNLISMISSAYVAHYNAPKIWDNLAQPSPRRYDIITAIAFGFSALVYVLVSYVGFATFGVQSSGMILNNYASSDLGATIARVAVGAGIVCGFPLTFTALRDGVCELLNIPTSIAPAADTKNCRQRNAPSPPAASTLTRDQLTIPLTSALLGVITAFALVLRNVGVVVSFGGALIGSMLIYTIPAVMNIGNIRQHHGLAAKNRGVVDVLQGRRVELWANHALAVTGVVVAVLGVAQVYCVLRLFVVFRIAFH